MMSRKEKRAVLEISKNQNGGEVEVKLGESFEVRLAENPTTGYRWAIRGSGVPCLKVEEDTFEPPGSGALGAGGARRWRFGTVQEGIADLVMEYRRSWEKRAAETFKVSIHVKSR
jgi:inhibitor of cysteine peptidase